MKKVLVLAAFAFFAFALAAGPEVAMTVSPVLSCRVLRRRLLNVRRDDLRRSRCYWADRSGSSAKSPPSAEFVRSHANALCCVAPR